jgi:capsid protein
LIESHRVETPPDRQTDERIVDGIQVDERGRPVGYWVREQVFHGGQFSLFSQDRFTYVPAEQMIHIFEPSRPGMYRGLPFSYAVMNDLHDLDDLQILEMDAAKDAARTSKVVKTKTGEMPMEDFIRNRIRKGTSSDVDGTSGGSSRDREEYYKEVLGADAVVMRAEDEYDQFKSERPSVAVQSYWEHLISKVCAGHGISKLLVFPHSMQGTVTRADLDVANAFFRSRSAVLATFFAHVYHYWLDWAVLNIIELSDPVASYKKVRVRPPRSVNVDVGRNSRAVLDELKAGVRTFEDVYGELGDDYTMRLRQRAKEIRLIEDLAKEFGVKASQISDIAESAPAQAQPNPRDPSDEPEPGQPEPAERATA